MRNLITAAAAFLYSISAFAGTPTTALPEPGTLALLAIAGVAGIVARNRRK